MSQIAAPTTAEAAETRVPSPTLPLRRLRSALSWRNVPSSPRCAAALPVTPEVLIGSKEPYSMAVKATSLGACTYCSREVARGGMGRHLASCEDRREAIRSADAAPGDDTVLVHVQVQDAHDGNYWLHLEIDGSASLKQLDSYLRAIWLECCGHMSEFSVGGWGGSKVGMTRKVHQALPPGAVLTHIYDFGTESVTLVKAVTSRTGKRITPRPIALMARNALPSASCQDCGSVARYLCVGCAIEEDQPGTLCAAHATSHAHEEYDDPIRLVNSPRLGMCGYSGPAEPPY